MITNDLAIDFGLSATGLNTYAISQSAARGVLRRGGGGRGVTFWARHINGGVIFKIPTSGEG